jgi:uncharacterized HAD superfamily protein
MKASRDSKGKERYSLGSTVAARMVARRWTKGADKYTKYNEGGIMVQQGDHNWKKGFDTSDLIDSLERHVQAFKRGEVIDWDWSDELNKKHGLSTHLDGIIVNAEMLLDQYFRNLPDNRDFTLSNKRIGLDIDGVIADTLNVSTAEFEHYGDPHFLSDYPKWLEDEHEILRTALTPEVDTMNFEPVVYITARPEDIQAETERWLFEQGLPQAPVVFTEDKAKACKDHMVELFVEDCYDHFCDVNNAGIKCLLMDRSYNRKHFVGDLRIKSLRL